MSRGDGHAEAIATVSLATFLWIPVATAQVLQGQGRIDVPSPGGPFGSGLPPFWQLRISIRIAGILRLMLGMGELRSKLQYSKSRRRCDCGWGWASCAQSLEVKLGLMRIALFAIGVSGLG